MGNRELKRFPPWLNQGSRGDAVLALKEWCRDAKIGPWERLVLDSEFRIGGPLSECIRALQVLIGLDAADLDGNLGQGTRRRLREFMRDPANSGRFNVHPDDEAMPEGAETTYIGPADTDYALWNEKTATAAGAFLERTSLNDLGGPDARPFI